MTGEQWAVIVAATVPAVFSFLGVIVANRARDAAKRAERATRAVGVANDEEHATTNDLLDHLRRDVGGMREDVRRLDSRIDRLDGRVDNLTDTFR